MSSFSIKIIEWIRIFPRPWPCRSQCCTVKTLFNKRSSADSLFRKGVIPSEAVTGPCGHRLQFTSWSYILLISIEIALNLFYIELDMLQTTCRQDTDGHLSNLRFTPALNNCIFTHWIFTRWTRTFLCSTMNKEPSNLFNDSFLRLKNLGRLWLAYTELQVDFTGYNWNMLTMDSLHSLMNHPHRSVMSGCGLVMVPIVIQFGDGQILKENALHSLILAEYVVQLGPEDGVFQEFEILVQAQNQMGWSRPHTLQAIYGYSGEGSKKPFNNGSTINDLGGGLWECLLKIIFSQRMPLKFIFFLEKGF